MGALRAQSLAASDLAIVRAGLVHLSRFGIAPRALHSEIEAATARPIFTRNGEIIRWMTTKPAPRGLAARGRSLWREVTTSYSMNPAEAVILHELCRVVDVLDRLAAELAASDDVLVGASRGQLRPNPFGTIVEFEPVRPRDRN